jgi:hypothetical protein
MIIYKIHIDIYKIHYTLALYNTRTTLSVNVHTGNLNPGANTRFLTDDTREFDCNNLYESLKPRMDILAEDFDIIENKFNLGMFDDFINAKQTDSCVYGVTRSANSLKLFISNSEKHIDPKNRININASERILRSIIIDDPRIAAGGSLYVLAKDLLFSFVLYFKDVATMEEFYNDIVSN